MPEFSLHSASCEQRYAILCDEDIYGNMLLILLKMKDSKRQYLLPVIENYPPPAIKGKYIKIKYITQLPSTQIPTFVFFANLPQYVKEPYRRFLENKIRAKYDFTGTPMHIFIRQK